MRLTASPACFPQDFSVENRGRLGHTPQERLRKSPLRHDGFLLGTLQAC